MKKGLLGCVLLLVIGAVVVALMVGGVYNRLVTLDEGVKSAWSQVENVYQRRTDLIPNLVETVKGARDFERDTLTAVVEARAKVGQVSIAGVPTAEQLQKFQAAQDGLSSALSRLLVVVERYPELKSNQNFMKLQDQLEGTENRVSVERRRYNETVLNYNRKIRTFPGALLAGIFGFERMPLFEAEAGSKKAPQVKF